MNLYFCQGLFCVTTLEIRQHKIDQARVNFDRAGLARKIEITDGNALEYFKQLDQQYDFIFLDAERGEYMDFAEEVIASLRSGSLLVCDNAVSRKSELDPFMGFIKKSKSFLEVQFQLAKVNLLHTKMHNEPINYAPTAPASLHAASLCFGCG